jgi:hypothetical protein
MTRPDVEERFWSVKFSSVPYEVYAYGLDPLTAIYEARQEFGGEFMGGALVRPAVYKEWDYGTELFTNGGDFIKDTSKPCRECGEPVPFHTHREELGFCQPCQSAYLDEGEMND